MGDFRFVRFFRALAAFWVLTAHCVIWGGWYGVPLPSAKIAVDLFMMISGFLMVATTQREPMDDPMNRSRFWLRRFFRIAPAYYVVLLLVVVAQGPFLDGYRALQALSAERWGTGGPYDPAR